MAIAHIFLDNFNAANSQHHLRHPKGHAIEQALISEATNLRTKETPISKKEESRWNLDCEKRREARRPKAKISLGNGFN